MCVVEETPHVVHGVAIVEHRSLSISGEEAVSISISYLENLLRVCGKGGA
jgi:hypothetical protein